MKIDVVTLFPDMFEGPFKMSMMKKAQDLELVEIRLHDLRQFGLGPRRTVDDTPYGGGPGMVLKPEPVFAAVDEIKADRPAAKIAVMTPSGAKYSQATAQRFSQLSELIIICGHYEGFDERILSLADYEISIGDYVLTGGELPAMVVIDSTVRLLSGVLGDADSASEETFADGSLEYPHYTRPVEFKGMKVPEVLQRGHHAEIAAWRKEQSAAKTKKNRPDLLQS